jgi:tetratricopeptide (TPR) repeat protein
MPSPFKLIPALLLFCASIGVRASTLVDTTRKMPFAPSKTMSYQMSDFSAYIKEGISQIRSDSIDTGIKLLSTGFNAAASRNNLNRVLNYQVLELVDVVNIAAAGKLSPGEMKPLQVFIKAIFVNPPKDVEAIVLPVLNKAPVTDFTRRLKVLLLSDKHATVTPALDELLARMPNLANANILKAEILYDQRKYTECAGYCTKVIGFLPQRSQAYFMRARCNVRMKQLDNAKADYDKAISLFPQHYEALYERSDMRMDDKQYREAINGYQASQAVMYEYKWSNYNIARCYNNLHIADSAMYFVNLHLNRFSGDAEGLNLKGEIYHGQRDYAAALTHYNLAIAANPGVIFFYGNRGNAYFQQNDINSALADYKKALSLSKDNYYFLARVGNCYHALRQDEKALTWYQLGAKAKPDDKGIYVDMDLSLGVLGRNKEGIVMLKKALAIDSTYAIANGNMGWDCYSIGDYDGCIKYSYKALSLEEDATYAMFNIALATLCKGDFEKAKELYTQFVKTCKEKNYPPVTDGAVSDLNDLIKKKQHIEEATYIIENILKKTD